MIKTEFIHTSFAGSYYVPCVILKTFKTTARIRYTDPLSEEVITEHVHKDLLKKFDEPTELERARTTISRLRKQIAKSK